MSAARLFELGSFLFQMARRTLSVYALLYIYDCICIRCALDVYDICIRSTTHVYATDVLGCVDLYVDCAGERVVRVEYDACGCVPMCACLGVRV